ncbi:hypothetical protein [Photobacterium leiognathi]|uniref:hypothetical protein n=1 Tax=Photobacterium leiognathi TaxID=553611 RepID=UPI00298160A3|nr:hypothetical protein [Photobacterium leiognathi]
MDSYYYIAILITMNITAFLIARLYSNSSSDIYNHMAFIRSLDNRMVIKSSAFREKNTYPPLIHYMYGFIKRINLINYFSFIILTFNQLIIYLWSLQYFNNTNSLILVAISILSTSLFIDLRSYNARIIGVLLFNILLLSSLSIESNGINLFWAIVASICIILLVITSRFAHQMVFLFLLPSSIIYGQLYFIVIYFLTLLLVFTTNILNSKEVLLGHIKHLYYYYKRGVDFWLPGGYWREFNEPISKVTTINFKRLVFILIKEPISILALLYLLYFFIFMDVPFSFTDTILIFSIIFYIIVAISERLDNFIGDAYRYWEYISLVLAASIIDKISTYPMEKFKVSSELPVVIVFIFSFFCLYLFYSLNKMRKKLERENRLENNRYIYEVINVLPYKNILTIPISISNVFAVNTDKKYYYGYTYYGFWFLEKAGLYPYFKIKNNILNKSYIKTVIIDSTQVPDEFSKKITIEYGFTLYKEVGSYRIYLK